MPAVLLAIAGCFQWYEQPLPVPFSEQPKPVPSGLLRAGFGRADITPPPGVGLSGYGPEGKRAAGYRLRLYARALVLEDRAGEKVAILVADLGHVSPNLHRLTAERIRESTGIGADRLIVSATHTHAGPGHHYAEREYNQGNSQVSGYDPAMVDFLVSRFTRALLDAYRQRRPARIAWGMTPVWGHTRNRSYDAFLRNEPKWAPPSQPPDSLDTARTAVDPTWTMVRVDTVGGPGNDQHYPAGAFSIFPMHGTGNPAANELLDPDIHGIVDRVVERHIDSLNRRRPSSGTEAVHLLANGTEGDVSPNWPLDSRCRTPDLRPTLGPGGPRTPAAPWDWLDPPRTHVALCLATARTYVNAVGETLGRRAAALFDSLGGRLTDTVSIGVAFRALSLRGHDGLCRHPELGTSVAAGAKDGPTRVRGWKLFGMFPIGLEEGGSAAKKHPKGCQQKKQVLMAALHIQRRVIGEHGLPEVAQLSLVRLGDLLLAAVPAEVTTVAGAEIKRAIQDSARANRFPADSVAVIGLANGYIQYVATAAEYAVQDYEGGSTLYGPESAAVLAGELGALAGELGRMAGRSPPNPVPPLTAYPGEPKDILPRADAGHPPELIERAFLALSCRGDTVAARWLDAYPGRLTPADTLVLRIEAYSDREWHPVAWDDDPYVEVRAVKPKGKRYVWEVRWDRRRARDTVRVVLLARESLPQVSDSCPRRAPMP